MRNECIAKSEYIKQMKIRTRILKSHYYKHKKSRTNRRSSYSMKIQQRPSEPMLGTILICLAELLVKALVVASLFVL